jgi:hypothetical protein
MPFCPSWGARRVSIIIIGVNTEKKVTVNAPIPARVATTARSNLSMPAMLPHEERPPRDLSAECLEDVPQPILCEARDALKEGRLDGT